MNKFYQLGVEDVFIGDHEFAMPREKAICELPIILSLLCQFPVGLQRLADPVGLKDAVNDLVWGFWSCLRRCDVFVVCYWRGLMGYGIGRRRSRIGSGIGDVACIQRY
jgi:hypothetical protein